jgi:hypothetical protein
MDHTVSSVQLRRQTAPAAGLLRAAPFQTHLVAVLSAPITPHGRVLAFATDALHKPLVGKQPQHLPSPTRISRQRSRHGRKR